MKAVILSFILLTLKGSGDAPLIENCWKFNQLNTSVRDGKANREQIVSQIRDCLNDIRSEMPKSQTDKEWAFPVEGYDAKAIGGKNGNGYQSKGYLYLDGNKHKAHPAHDIFIEDRNQDCRDDRTGKRVKIKSVTDGTVVAQVAVWNPGSALRGGKYVMVYHPKEDLISYYAHLDSTVVHPGQIVGRGELLGFLGRTGLNAWKKRSPTHLHLMILKTDDKQAFVPVNPYSKWKLK